MKAWKYALPALLLTLLSGCLSVYSNTRLVEVKANTEKTAQPPYQSVVVGLLVDHEIRPLLEHAIVERLRARGVDARAALDVYGHKGIEGKSRDYLAQRMRDEGFDSAVAIHLLDKNVEDVHVGGEASSQAPVTAGLTMQPETFGPDFFITETLYVTRTDFWDVAQQAIVWQGTTVTANQRGLEAGAEKFANTIANGLVEAGLFDDQ